MPRILVVEDSAELAEGIRHNLEIEGYEVHLAADGREGISAVASFSPDLILLDVMLPHIDGFDVLRTIRERGVTTPVMMLTARGEEADQVRAFRLDADQYVTKPFRLLELLERIAMMLRRASTNGTGSRVRFGDVSIDVDARTITKRDAAVSLTPKAWELLLALIEQEGKVLSRQELLRAVWKHQADVVTRTVDAHISELRQKLEDDAEHPRHILTVWKAGYRFDR